MDITFSDELAYMSAPASASSSSQEMCFYSAPTTPSRVKLSGFQTEPTTPRTYEDANSNLDEFEFETSQRFNLGDFDIEKSQKDEKPFDHMQEQKQRLQRQRGDSLPTMAFADELFCDGKVLPLISTLKLPPRLLHNGNGNKMSTQSSTASSPRSPGSVLRLPFSSHSLWNDDFDPFMVALEKVKEEKRGKPKGKHGLEPNPNEGTEAHCCLSAQLICELQSEPLKKASRSPNMLSESKGLVFERQVRVGNDEPFEPKATLVTQLAMEREKDESNETKRGGFWTRKRKREKIMKFLFGNAHMGKASAIHKLAALGKPAFLTKLGLKPGAPTPPTQWDKDETTGDMTKMTLVCYKPK